MLYLKNQISINCVLLDIGNVQATHTGFQVQGSPNGLWLMLFLLMLSPPMPQLHCPSAWLSSAAILKSCTRPNPSEDQSFWKSIYTDGGENSATPTFQCPLPLTPPLPPPRNYMEKSSELFILHTWCYPTGRNVEPGRGARSGGSQMVWVTYVVSRLQIKARLSGSGARITFEKKSQVNPHTGCYWATMSQHPWILMGPQLNPGQILFFSWLCLPQFHAMIPPPIQAALETMRKIHGSFRSRSPLQCWSLDVIDTFPEAQTHPQPPSSTSHLLVLPVRSGNRLVSLESTWGFRTPQSLFKA